MVRFPDTGEREPPCWMGVAFPPTQQSNQDDLGSRRLQYIRNTRSSHWLPIKWGAFSTCLSLFWEKFFNIKIETPGNYRQEHQKPPTLPISRRQKFQHGMPPAPGLGFWYVYNANKTIFGHSILSSSALEGQSLIDTEWRADNYAVRTSRCNFDKKNPKS